MTHWPRHTRTIDKEILNWKVGWLFEKILLLMIMLLEFAWGRNVIFIALRLISLKSNFQIKSDKNAFYYTCANHTLKVNCLNDLVGVRIHCSRIASRFVEQILFFSNQFKNKIALDEKIIIKVRVLGEYKFMEVISSL